MSDKEFTDIFPEGIPTVPEPSPTPTPEPSIPVRDNWGGSINENIPTPTMDREEKWPPPENEK